MNYAQKIGKILIEKNLKISTAESCTGGLLSSALTDVSGSSAYITFNLVTYANDIKASVLSVKKDTLLKKGAVSEECAKEMAIGLYKLTNSDICVSTTGIAGPTGGTSVKPVGLMYSAIYFNNKVEVYKILLSSDTPRTVMKKKFVQAVLKNILSKITEEKI